MKNGSSNNRMRRRHFLQGSALAGAMLPAAVAQPAASDAMPAKAADNTVENAVDVLVIGGGTSGTIAAIQAARAGAKTMLVERASQLGGTTTVGGVAFPGLFHAWGKQVIAGIGWELVSKSVELDGGTLPDFTKPTKRNQHAGHQVLINPFLYAALAEEACIEAGVMLCYYEFPLSGQAAAAGWSVEIVGPGTRRRVVCKQLIDCTGGADVVGMLGYERVREDWTQPGSYLYRLGNAFYPGRERLDSVYVPHADPSTSITRTRATIDGRRLVLKQLRAQRTSPDAPRRLAHMQPETAFRESYRILGEIVISEKDYVSGRAFDDAVCNAFYPIDLHQVNGPVNPRPLDEGVVPTVPLRALVPKGSRNLLVAGRSISSDRLANSALRVQATCMAMGQSAGAAAALAARHGATPLDVPLADLRQLLARHGAIIPGAERYNSPDSSARKSP